MSDLSPIEMKKENVSNDQNKKKSNWTKFGKSILINLIYTILLGLIGSNFLYILFCNLDTWFPSDPNKLPYQSNSPQGLREKAISMFSNVKSLFKGGSESEMLDDVCKNIKKNIQGNNGKYVDLLNKLGFDKVGFPYTLINDEAGLVNIVKNLFGESARYSYTTDRELLKKILIFFSGFENMGENLLFVLSLPILITLLLLQIPLILGFVTSIISFIGTYFKSMSKNYGWIITIIISLFTFLFTLSIGGIWSGMIGVAQSIQLFVTILLMPLFDFDAIRQIIYCKSHLLYIIFVLFTILSAFTHLENLPASVMSITLIILIYSGLKQTKKI